MRKRKFDENGNTNALEDGWGEGERALAGSHKQQEDAKAIALFVRRLFRRRRVLTLYELESLTIANRILGISAPRSVGEGGPMTGAPNTDTPFKQHSGVGGAERKQRAERD